MNGLLLDTHVLLWLATDPLKVPAGVRTYLEDANHLYVSAASAYEIAQKVRRGRLPSGSVVVARWQELIRNLMAEERPLTTAEMLHAGSLEWDHRDPFDRILVAQARLGGFELVTKDAAIQAYPGITCGAWE